MIQILSFLSQLRAGRAGADIGALTPSPFLKLLHKFSLFQFVKQCTIHQRSFTYFHIFPKIYVFMNLFNNSSLSSITWFLNLPPCQFLPPKGFASLLFGGNCFEKCIWKPTNKSNIANKSVAKLFSHLFHFLAIQIIAYNL